MGMKIITPALQMEDECLEHIGHGVSELERVWVQTQFMWLLGHIMPHHTTIHTKQGHKNHWPYF